MRPSTPHPLGPYFFTLLIFFESTVASLGLAYFPGKSRNTRPPNSVQAQVAFPGRCLHSTFGSCDLQWPPECPGRVSRSPGESVHYSGRLGKTLAVVYPLFREGLENIFSVFRWEQFCPLQFGHERMDQWTDFAVE